MNRRDLFRTAAAVVGSPAVAAAQSSSKPAGVPAEKPFKPAVFDDHQFATLAILVDLIIPDTDTPGARAAGVHRHIDEILAAAEHQQRERIIAGLSFLDGRALQAYQHPFATCSKDQQIELLTGLDKSGDNFFRMAKGLTTRVYYATQPGFRELNKGGRVPATFGCPHGSHA